MINYFRKSISRQLSVMITVIICIAIIVFGLIDIMIWNNKINNEISNLAHSLQDRLTISLKSHIWNFNKEDTQNILIMEFNNNKDIYKILVINPDNTLFTGITRDKQWEAIKINNSLEEELKHIIFTQFYIKDNENILANIKIYISKKFKNQEIFQIIFFNILRMAVIIFFLIVRLKLILNKILFFPLKSIVNKISYLSSGDLTQNFESELINEMAFFQIT